MRGHPTREQSTQEVRQRLHSRFMLLMQCLKPGLTNDSALLDDLQDGASDSDSGNEVDQRRLQLYERSRLRYYYAVVECQDVRTAAHLYAECDGIEFLRSACKLDMRFVPETQVSLPHGEPVVLADPVPTWFHVCSLS